MSRPSPPLAPRLTLLQEQRYRRHFLREDGRQTAIVMAVVGTAYLASVVNDLPQLRGIWLVVSLAARGLLLVVMGVVIVLLRRARWPRQQDRAAHLGLAAVALFVSAVHLTKLSTGRIQGPLIASGTLLCILYFAQRGRVIPRAIVGSVIMLGGVTLVALANHQAAMDSAARLTTALALGALNVVGIYSAHAFEVQRRQRFAAERGERLARQELTVKLRELAAEKEHAEAMSHARTAFLTAMSHEFRTPMNAVIGLSDLLLDSPLAPEHRAHVRTISDSARALLRLLEDILDFAKIDAQKLTLAAVPFDLHRLVASLVDMLRPAARARSLNLLLDRSPDVPEHVVGDDARLRQVLVNLVSNAIKFTERGAVRLRITAHRIDESDHEILFRVEDTGIGIAPEVLARLFRPFEQADGTITRRHGGTGLGLAISKQIVVAMGGDIHVESEPGRGSIFSFTLRLAASPSPAEAPTALERPKDRPPLTILVVDDHPINREVARAKLGRLGYPVDVASDGPEAIEAAAKKNYDLVFMDLQMPGMSGVAATERITEMAAGQRGPHMVAMTASVFEADREACRRVGMCDFIGKPIDLAHLDAVLWRVAEERGAAAPSLAREPIAELRQIEHLGEPHFFERLCRIFLDDTRERLPRMKDALGRGDAQELAREAHTLTSTSATLGAIEMSELCAQVESAAREGRIEDIGAALGAISAQLVEVERSLLREMAGGPRHALSGAL